MPKNDREGVSIVQARGRFYQGLREFYQIVMIFIYVEPFHLMKILLKKQVSSANFESQSVILFRYMNI